MVIGPVLLLSRIEGQITVRVHVVEYRGVRGVGITGPVAQQIEIPARRRAGDGTRVERGLAAGDGDLALPGVDQPVQPIVRVERRAGVILAW